MNGVLKDIEASTHGVEAPKVIGTVFAAPPSEFDASYSLHPPTELHVPPRVKPLVAVNVVVPEAPSAFPTMNESVAGV